MTSRAPLFVNLAAIASGFGVLALSLLVAPQAANFSSPMTQRIFYWHVPSAWVAYLAFAVAAVASARYLATREMRHDRLAAASVEVGLVFSAIALATGLTWAEAEFTGYDAFQDAKVVSLVALLLAYAAYLTLRAGMEDPAKRARLSAVFGLVALVAVPLSYFASRVSLHPDFTREDQGLDPALGMILGACVLLFTVLYAALAWQRTRLAAIADELADLRAMEAS